MSINRSIIAPYNSVDKMRILGECLLISSLSGKVSRRLVKSLGLLSLVNFISKDVNVVFHSSINKRVESLFKLAIMTLILIYMSIQRH